MADPAAPLDLELLTQLQPGYARLMPEIGARFWKAYYAAEAGCWELADFQLRAMNKLFKLGTITRPKYKDDVEEYLEEEVDPLRQAIAAKDFTSFKKTLRRSHRLRQRMASALEEGLHRLEAAPGCATRP